MCEREGERGSLQHHHRTLGAPKAHLLTSQGPQPRWKNGPWEAVREPQPVMLTGASFMPSPVSPRGLWASSQNSGSGETATALWAGVQWLHGCHLGAAGSSGTSQTGHAIWVPLSPKCGPTKLFCALFYNLQKERLAGLDFGDCCELNIGVPPNSSVEPNPQCDNFGVKSLGGDRS